MNCGLKCDMHGYSPIQRCSRKGHSIHLLVFGHKLFVWSSSLSPCEVLMLEIYEKCCGHFLLPALELSEFPEFLGHNKFPLSRLSHGRSVIQIQKIPMVADFHLSWQVSPLLQPSTRQFEKGPTLWFLGIFSTRTPSAYRRFDSYPWSVFRTIKFCSSRSQKESSPIFAKQRTASIST